MKGNYKEMRTILAHIYWNDKMKNKAGAEIWNILKSELDSVINRYVPMKKQGKRSRKNTCQNRLSKRLDINKIRGRFINIRERIKIMKFTKRH